MRTANHSPWTASRDRTQHPDFETSLRLLARSGFHDSHLDDVAVQCATSKQAVYLRWPSKSHLAAAAVVSGLARAKATTPDSGSAFADLTRVPGNAIDDWQSTPLGERSAFVAR